jgi:hypothetical protein
VLALRKVWPASNAMCVTSDREPGIRSPDLCRIFRRYAVIGPGDLCAGLKKSEERFGALI